MIKIVFIGAQNQPRVIKRIMSFYEQSYRLEVYGFDRDRFHGVNTLPPDITIHKFEKTEDGGKYIKKLFTYIKQIHKVYKAHRKENAIFYSFGILPAFFFYVFKSRNYLYEISDIIYANFNNSLLRSIIKKVDQKIIRNSLATVMTSQGFVSYIFNNNQPSNIIILPNKISTHFKSINRTRRPITNSIRFGFIGWLRYPNTIFRFAEIIGKRYPDYSFAFFGDSDYRDNAKELSERYDNVFFSGPFKNPEDLERIYDKVDVVVSCYDTSTINERIAEPNKLYESMFFCKPIIVSRGTFLASQVEKYRCGYCLDASSDASIIEFLNGIMVMDLNTISTRLYQINAEELIDNPSPLLNFVGKL